MCIDPADVLTTSEERLRCLLPRHIIGWGQQILIAESLGQVWGRFVREEGERSGVNSVCWQSMWSGHDERFLRFEILTADGEVFLTSWRL